MSITWGCIVVVSLACRGKQGRQPYKTHKHNTFNFVYPPGQSKMLLVNNPCNQNNKGYAFNSRPIISYSWYCSLCILICITSVLIMTTQATQTSPAVRNDNSLNTERTPVNTSKFIVRNDNSLNEERTTRKTSKFIAQGSRFGINKINNQQERVTLEKPKTQQRHNQLTKMATTDLQSRRSESKEPHNKQQNLQMFLEDQGHSVKVSWIVFNFNKTTENSTNQDIQVQGYTVSYKMEGRENYDSSRLGRRVRTFLLHSLHQDKQYSICVQAVGYDDEPLQQVCSAWSKTSMKLVMGAIAGSSFLVPCAMIVAWVLYKDRAMRSAEINQIDNSDETAMICQDEEKLRPKQDGARSCRYHKALLNKQNTPQRTHMCGSHKALHNKQNTPQKTHTVLDNKQHTPHGTDNRAYLGDSEITLNKNADTSMNNQFPTTMDSNLNPSDCSNISVPKNDTADASNLRVSSLCKQNLSTASFEGDRNHAVNKNHQSKTSNSIIQGSDQQTLSSEMNNHTINNSVVTDGCCVTPIAKK